jgi:hypothetical protein
MGGLTRQLGQIGRLHARSQQMGDPAMHVDDRRDSPDESDPGQRQNPLSSAKESKPATAMAAGVELLGHAITSMARRVT